MTEKRDEQAGPELQAAKERIKARVDEWAVKVGVRMKEVHIRTMKTKWASLSTDGRIMLNSELLTLPRELCDYVIVHELVHLKAPNHGILFKSYMSMFLPEWQKLERELGKKR